MMNSMQWDNYRHTLKDGENAIDAKVARINLFLNKIIYVLSGLVLIAGIAVGR